jgi:hypothetical protein
VVVGFTTGAGIPFQLLNTVPKMQLAPKLAMSLDGSPASRKSLVFSTVSPFPTRARALCPLWSSGTPGGSRDFSEHLEILLFLPCFPSCDDNTGQVPLLGCLAELERCGFRFGV